MRVTILTCLVALIALCAWDRASACPAPAKAEAIDIPGHPFSALPSADGCWIFVSAETGKSHSAIVVLRNREGRFELDHQFALDNPAFGESLSPGEHLLAVAAGSDTALFDVTALERGDANPLLGLLHNGRRAGAVYAAMTSDEKLLFVSDEDEKRISVFDLAKVRAQGVRDDAVLGRIPTGAAPVGLALSPDGRWLYATSEVGPGSTRNAKECASEERNGRTHPPGLLLVVDVAKVAGDSAHALAAAFPAGCNPVRVAPSPDGKFVWVTARGGNELLRFTSGDWSSGVSHIASKHFDIGSNPVGVAVRPDGKQVWVALSDRFGKGKAAGLAGLADAREDGPSTVLSAPASGFPREVAFLAGGRALVVTLFNADRVEIVPLPE